MQQRVSVITLGVSDLERALAFYEGLGWTDARRPDDEIVFFQAGGMVVALWDRRLLAEESALPDPGGFGGIALAHNVGSEAEVDEVLAQAIEAGGRVTRPARRLSWGGYSGTFTDPDGHPWEVAHNPAWPLAEDGSVRLG
jgi:catechol 2,3-dioxygenase-like lactoylglutathione lyase family enzyme